MAHAAQYCTTPGLHYTRGYSVPFMESVCNVYNEVATCFYQLFSEDIILSYVQIFVKSWL